MANLVSPLKNVVTEGVASDPHDTSLNNILKNLKILPLPFENNFPLLQLGFLASFYTCCLL